MTPWYLVQHMDARRRLMSGVVRRVEQVGLAQGDRGTVDGLEGAKPVRRAIAPARQPWLAMPTPGS
jgi:hypothetical protein